MLAFSGCYFGGGEKERQELGEIRKRWATLPVRLQFFLIYNAKILSQVAGVIFVTMKFVTVVFILDEPFRT